MRPFFKEGPWQPRRNEASVRLLTVGKIVALSATLSLWKRKASAYALLAWRSRWTSTGVRPRLAEGEAVTREKPAAKKRKAKKR